MKNICLLLILLFLSAIVYGKEKTDVIKDSIDKNNTVFLELLGNGIVYSLNYERKFHALEGKTFAGRLGMAYIPKGFNGSDDYGPSVLGELVYIHGRKKHFFEMGGGLSYFYLKNDYKEFLHLDTDFKTKLYWEEPDCSELLGVLRIGYRYQNLKHNFTIRVGFTPLIPIASFGQNRTYEEKNYPWGGVSIGKSF